MRSFPYFLMLGLCCHGVAQKPHIRRNPVAQTLPSGKLRDQVAQFEKLTPTERQRALEAMPPKQRQKIQARLDQLQKLTPEERKLLQGRLERFNNLSPADQKRVRESAKDLKELPAGRQKAVRQELNRLRRLPATERGSHMNTPEFTSRFSPHEQEILRSSSLVLPTVPPAQ
jgi:phage-related protein